MKYRWKLLFMVFAVVAAVFIEPVSYVRADETSGENYDRTLFPRLNSSEVLFEKKEFFDWFGFKELPEENCIQELVLAHRKTAGTDYTLYNLVCDFELKTMGIGEEVTTSNYTYTIDMENYEKGFFDSLLVRFNLKEDYFEHAFDYFEIVRNADGFQERDITGKEKYFTYNTVISQADFYFVRKSDGEKGEARRFTFTWDANFWLQKCTKIEFSWYDHETEIEKEISSVESETGVDGFTSNTTDSYLDIETSVWDGILGFLIDLPAAIIAFFSGFIEIYSSLIDLFKVIFSFLPGFIFDMLGVVLFVMLAISVSRIIKGD
ncbi:MAG: hypothetical protein J6C07_09660 [Lachnospiraceae bacterium]|nr:hypothetical protein [Lachnospiraceae bacterium]